MAGGDHQADELDRLRAESIQLRASRRRLAAAADAERRDIERALHDGPQQRLVGLAANLELATRAMDPDPAAAKELLTEMGREVERALEESRTLAQRIYPPLLEAGGLVAALRSAAATANVSTRIDIARDRSYPPEIAGALYFSCVAILDTAPAGTTVAITARSQEDELAFEIAVEGDLDATGLLRDRIEAVGGRCAIESGPGRGTRVIGSLPLRA
jgi:signal transduction histidine kinase